ncbi:putative dimethylmenaquinone methyltransferase [Actinacidiphila reveromycinica]|uniref:Putative 4-hydroxy-4-methyl-2-oxoglutarate aldolase n=1 Tax=Actinacidiphila reveromycinica TaxID=659352 RepID=A0A7U3UY73_9ACTN|nr:RraA family protein [Streptomyces sp. SN-593]BBB00961.1 putative dimethylmenaquinone methyltransferase [Streptomyces sp. SN-593]
MNVGFRVHQDVLRPDRALLEGFAGAAVGNLSDAMHGLYTMDSGIRPVVTPAARVTGPAVTVAVSPGDGLMLREAIGLARPGDVLVVNAFGATDRAVLGGTVLLAARDRGVAGLVVDGAVRDLDEIASLSLPVAARAVTPRSGTSTAGWGEVNVPVACGGVVVQPGDVVAADGDGIVVVPADQAAAVLAAHREVEAAKGRPSDLASGGEARRSRADVVFHRTRAAMAERGATVVPAAYHRWPVPPGPTAASRPDRA